MGRLVPRAGGAYLVRRDRAPGGRTDDPSGAYRLRYGEAGANATPLLTFTETPYPTFTPETPYPSVPPVTGRVFSRREGEE